MRMADPAAKLRTFATHFTNSSHILESPDKTELRLYQSGQSLATPKMWKGYNWHMVCMFTDGGAMADKETILVVEDADEIRKLVCGMLDLQGYNCLAAADGVDALRLIEDGAERVDLLLTDMVMPKMMGSELARHVAQRRPDIRILLMSGFCDDPVVRSLERVPAIFIAKPFTAAALCTKIRQSLDQPWRGFPNAVVEPVQL
jgi:CheY-like chemotaxis protein